MIRMLPRTLYVGFALTLLVSSGCQKGDAPKTASAKEHSDAGAHHDDHKGHEDHDEHEEHEDHEHLEHFVPPHKPASFEELITQLFFRCETLPKLAEADDAEFQKRSAELRDILNWIPELAADSNLKRKGFESAIADGQTLLQSFQASQGGKTLRMTDVQESLERLKALVPDSIEVAPNGQTNNEPPNSPQ
jgi:hypothetical protein